MIKRPLHAAVIAACAAGLVIGLGCKTNPAGKVPADTTIVKYKSPDIAELTGIDPDAGADDSVVDEPIDPAPPVPTPPAPMKPVAPTPKPAAPKAVAPITKGK
jgi:hypothetical protein